MATAKKTAANPAEDEEKQDVIYLVNPAGAIHTCTRDHARYRLRFVGWRVASKAEITKYQATRVQRSGRPLAQPWSPEPDFEPELPGESQG
jgi:hypothetical protein